ncbi:MAG: NnrS family protein [Verrucomicrobia bacterium]|nr:NnrS family protein [Verrucomicrobiota bacterium]
MIKIRARSLDLFVAEPFRFFFLFGVIAGLIGVMQWPYMFWAESASYPGQNHAFLMVEGFFAAFIFGFALTALPRMMDSKWRSASGTLVLAGLFIVTQSLLSYGPVWKGNAIFLVSLILFAFLLSMHMRHRKCLPPPGFVLLIPAILCAIAGGVLYTMDWGEETSSFALQLRTLLLFQAWPLLPFLGVCPFFLPKFVQSPSKHDLPDSSTPTLEWALCVGTAVVLFLGVFASMILEAGGLNRMGLILRGGFIGWYLWKELPPPLLRFKGDKLTKCLSFCLWALPLAYLFAGLLPAYRVAWVHWSLVGGLSALTLMVATRIMMGHSGKMQLLTRKSGWVLVMVLLIWVGMVSRVSGDIWPKIMKSHYIYGAICWGGAVLIWIIKVLPCAFQQDMEESS